ncbi:MAG: 30S ribosome-binding factor RbfA [Rhodospirillaceae bacterium]|nr:30S ribosome-binding factor RbfA [Rhodospirillaceae bacterium]
MTRRHRSGHSPQGASPRQLRVGEELRHALSSILVRGEMRDPDLRDCSITVTEVRMSPDLREARVFVLPLGGGNTDVILSGLKRAAPYLRTLMARAVQLRLAPTLLFSIDSSFDQASRVDNLLREHTAAPTEKESDDG